MSKPVTVRGITNLSRQLGLGKSTAYSGPVREAIDKAAVFNVGKKYKIYDLEAAWRALIDAGFRLPRPAALEAPEADREPQDAGGPEEAPRAVDPGQDAPDPDLAAVDLDPDALDADTRAWIFEKPVKAPEPEPRQIDKEMPADKKKQEDKPGLQLHSITVTDYRGIDGLTASFRPADPFGWPDKDDATFAAIIGSLVLADGPLRREMPVIERMPPQFTVSLRYGAKKYLIERSRKHYAPAELVWSINHRQCGRDDVIRLLRSILRYDVFKLIAPFD